MRRTWLAYLLLLLVLPAMVRADGPVSELTTVPQLTKDLLPLLKNHCVKCHGPGKSEGELNLSTPGTLALGGENGPTLVPGHAEESLLWQRVESDEMPPDAPLEAKEKALLRRWIEAGAAGLPTQASNHPSGDHWSFTPLARPTPPQLDDPRITGDIDRFLLAELTQRGLSYNPEADRSTLIRRVAFDLIGLPPTPEDVAAFETDDAADAYARMVERFLASPHYGERWGKFWLDAAGYADSNGYFNADTDRPLAYRYRDYVVRSFNADKPWDRFVLEQMAGDELAAFQPGEAASKETISLLEATHYLRNGQDGTGESDGNEEELRNDRYAVLDSCLQIVSSSLLGLTVQCAKCHDHKFEPLSQRDYHRWQSVFYPAFDIEHWSKPNERFVHANLPGELESWQRNEQRIDEEIATLRAEHANWVHEHPAPSKQLFHADFSENGGQLATHWSNTAPGDDSPGGSPAVRLDTNESPGVSINDGALQISQDGSGGNCWISTRQSFDWSPDAEGDWIQVTFDLVKNKLEESGTPALRIGYYVSLHDYDDNSPLAGGNVLVDGNPNEGGAELYVDYPGSDIKRPGKLGSAKYEPGHNYGVRITRLAKDQCQIEHLYDGLSDGKPITLPAEDLPPGGFGFEFCCGRSYVVDNVLVKTVDETQSAQSSQIYAELKERGETLSQAVDERNKERREKPGKIAWVTDRSAEQPVVYLLERGSHAALGEEVSPAPLTALAEPGESMQLRSEDEGETTGRRLAWAQWVTRPDSRAGGLMARVQVNRIWQQHFGVGIVPTLENLGVSGAAPSHPRLLDYLACEFVEGGWSVKHIHRLILNSAAFRQSSQPNERAQTLDPENQLLARMSVRRLDAEALRDAMLATSGQLVQALGGPYVPTQRDENGEVVVAAEGPAALRRSLYVQQRRTQTLSLLGVFDSPSIVFNCIQRPVSTIPLQSLSLLNSDFLRERAEHFAARLAAEAGADSNARIERAYLLAISRLPTSAELEASRTFIETQSPFYESQASLAPWTDFCQMLLASSAFLYVE